MICGQLAAREVLPRDHPDHVGHPALVADRLPVLGDLLELRLVERPALRVQHERGRLASARERPLDRVVDLDRLRLAVLERVALVRRQRLQLGLERQRDRGGDEPQHDHDPFRPVPAQSRISMAQKAARLRPVPSRRARRRGRRAPRSVAGALLGEEGPRGDAELEHALGGHDDHARDGRGGEEHAAARRAPSAGRSARSGRPPGADRASGSTSTRSRPCPGRTRAARRAPRPPAARSSSGGSGRSASGAPITTARASSGLASSSRACSGCRLGRSASSASAITAQRVALSPGSGRRAIAVGCVLTGQVSIGWSRCRRRRSCTSRPPRPSRCAR